MLNSATDKILALLNPATEVSEGELIIPITLFDSVNNVIGEPGNITFAMLMDYIKNPDEFENKNQCPLIKLGHYKNNTRSNGNFEYCGGIEIDYDGGNISIDDAAKRLKDHGINGVFYSTPSSTNEHPKWRLICPTRKKVASKLDPDNFTYDRRYYVAVLNSIFDGEIDPASFTDSQTYYIGKIKGANYQYKAVEGGLFIDNKVFMENHVFRDEPIPTLYPNNSKKREAVDDNDLPDEDKVLPKSELPALKSALDYLALEKRIADYGQGWRDICLSLKGSYLATLKNDALIDAASQDEIKDLYVNFSKQGVKINGENYTSQEILSAWDGLKNPGTGYKAILARASNAGWVNLSKSKQISRQNKGFTLTSLADLPKDRPPKQWLIKKMLEPGKLHALIGEPGAGKTFLALDMAWHLAHGESWNGNSVKTKGDIIYIAGEGLASIQDRVEALAIHYKKPMPGNFFISDRGVSFDDDNAVGEVVEAIRNCTDKPALVIIDTLHRNFSGDENSSKDIGKLLNNLTRINIDYGAAVLLVHHSGHGDKSRGRGSSSIRAAVDVEFNTSKKEGITELSCAKAKDFSPFATMQFRLDTIETNHIDDDGEKVTSAIPVYLGQPTTRKTNLKNEDKAALTLLENLIRDKGEDCPELTKILRPDDEEPFNDFDGNTSTGQIKGVKNADWKAAILNWLKENEPGLSNPRTKRDRIFEKLIKAGEVVEHNGMVTIVDL